jgi:hypothetical protein
MTSRHTQALAASICLLALFSGCAGGSATQEPQDTPKFTVENTDRFVALDAATQADVGCTGLQERTLDDGRLEVIANVKDFGDQPVKVDIQCAFSVDRVPPADDGSWRQLSIAAGATEVVRFTAPDTTAVRYTIRVRHAH